MLDEDKLKPRKGGVQSIEIGGLLLEQLVVLGGPATLKDLSAASGMPPAKAHRYLTSLSEIGLVSQQRSSGKYGLGPLALRLGLAAMSQNDVVERASELLQDLCNQLGVSGHLAIWSERGPVVVRSAHGGPPVISPIGVGSIFPLYRSATGQAFLAFMPVPTTLSVALEQRDVSQMSADEIIRLMEEARRNNYVLAAGNYIPGLNAIAFPIFGYDGSLCCTLTFIQTGVEFFSADSASTKVLFEAIEQEQARWRIKK